MTHYGSTISASFDGAVAISVLAISNILHISCSLSKGYQNHTEGLMGKERAALCLWSRAQIPSPQAASHPVHLRTSRVEFSFVSGGGSGTSSAAFEAHFPASLSCRPGAAEGPLRMGSGEHGAQQPPFPHLPPSLGLHTLLSSPTFPPFFLHFLLSLKQRVGSEVIVLSPPPEQRADATERGFPGPLLLPTSPCVLLDAPWGREGHLPGWLSPALSPRLLERQPR